MKYEYYVEFTEKEERKIKRQERLAALAWLGLFAFICTAEWLVETVIKIIGR